MTVSIEFSAEELARLREAAAGGDLPTYVHDAALEKASQPSFDELLAPVHEATRKSGISIEEIDAMADRAREEARQQRRAAAATKTP